MASAKKTELKCVMLGSHNVGKSCLVERFLHDRWSPTQHPTVGAAFVSKDMLVGKRSVALGVWDTAGAERYQAMTRHYYQGAQAAVICFDLTNAKTWKKAKFWVKEVSGECTNCVIALVGTKVDLLDDGKERGVEQDVVADFVKSVNAKLFEVSSKTGQNVQEPFMHVCTAFTQKPAKPAASYEPRIKLESPQDDSDKGSCCGKK